MSLTPAERCQGIVSYFSKHQPSPTTELRYETPFQLLTAVILSAQCTDKRVNIITPALFAAFPTPQTMALASPASLLNYLPGISYPNAKAHYLQQMATTLITRFHGILPTTVQELQQLAGVGRKTAHVVAATLYQQPTLGVDTHVFRVAKRLGLAPATAKTPLAVEHALMTLLPAALIHKAHHWLVLHGRYICVARKPKCGVCPLTPWCQYFETLTPM